MKLGIFILFLAWLAYTFSDVEIKLLWRDTYVLLNSLGYKIILRNQWHKFYGGSSFELLRVGKIYHYQPDKTEFILGFIGFQFSVRKKFYKDGSDANNAARENVSPHSSTRY
jgi:hypothetical protein